MRNWGGTHRYRAEAITAPTTLDELADIIRRTSEVRVVGTRHSFSGVSDSTVMISTARLGERFELDRLAKTVTIDGAMTYERLIELLDGSGFALPNLASLTTLSVAGAVTTATHGSGDRHRCLSTHVVGIDVLTASGEVVRRRRGDADFDGFVVSLGMLGVVLSLTLQLDDAVEVRQRVHADVPLGDLVDELDTVFASGDSVSAFTRWGDAAEQVWVKERLSSRSDPAVVLGSVPSSTVSVHPVPGGDPSDCTPQRDVAGPWGQRLPHFLPEAMPADGAEIQSEYFVPREHGAAAVQELARVGSVLQPVLLTSELRTVAADSLWLSPFADRDALAIHFTWHPNAREVAAAAARVESALEPFAPRPHWGKLFTPGHSTRHPTPRREDAIELATTLDPDGVFVNDWIRAEDLR